MDDPIRDVRKVEGSVHRLWWKVKGGSEAVVGFGGVRLLVLHHQLASTKSTEGASSTKGGTEDTTEGSTEEGLFLVLGASSSIPMTCVDQISLRKSHVMLSYRVVDVWGP